MRLELTGWPVAVDDGLDLAFAQGSQVALVQLLGERPDHRLRLGHERREVLIEEPFGLLTGDVGVLLFAGEVALVDGRRVVHEL